MVPSYRLLAARYLRKQTKQLLAQIDGISTDQDIEYVHRARVATRKLRAAFRLFEGCFPADSLRRWRRAVGNVTRALGRARDCDVQTEFLVGVLESVREPELYPGLARLLDNLQRRREKCQPKLLKSLRRFERTGVAGQMVRTTKSILKAGSAKSEPPARDLAAPHLIAAIDELVGFRECLFDETLTESHHEMRLAAKRLRYSLEILAPVYEGAFAEGIRATKDLQTLLGDLHDCDVWIEKLAAFRDEQRKRARKHFGHERMKARYDVGAVWLTAMRRKDRRRLMHEVRACWKSLEAEGVFDRLREGMAPARHRRPICDSASLGLDDAPGTHPAPTHSPETTENGGDDRGPGGRITIGGRRAKARASLAGHNEHASAQTAAVRPEARPGIGDP